LMLCAVECEQYQDAILSLCMAILPQNAGTLDQAD